MGGSLKPLIAAIAVAGSLVTGLVGTASAGDFIPYTAERLQSLQANADKPNVVFVNANWCPVCAKERPIVAKLIGATINGKHYEGDPSLIDMDVVYIDFDVQRDAWHSFHVTEQSTLIVFKGNKEVARAVGMTDPDQIKDLLMKAKG